MLFLEKWVKNLNKQVSTDNRQSVVFARFGRIRE